MQATQATEARSELRTNERTLEHLHHTLGAGVLALDHFQHRARLIVLALHQLFEALGRGRDGAGIDDVATHEAMVLH